MSPLSKKEKTQLRAFVDALISEQLRSEDVSISTKALEQLDMLLKDPSKNVLLTGREDQLIESIQIQLRLTYATHRSNPDVHSEVILLYQQLSLTLTSLIECDHLIKEVNATSLCQLFLCLISLVSDTFLTGMHLNFEPILFKLVERSDHTTCVVLLVNMMSPNDEETPDSIKVTELLIKCLWQFDQLLPSVIDQVDLRWMFLVIHYFFTQFPMCYWKDQPDNTPMRILKSLMHTVVKRLGSEVLNHLSMIPQPQTSEVVSYLRTSTGAIRPRG